MNPPPELGMPAAESARARSVSRAALFAWGAAGLGVVVTILHLLWPEGHFAEVSLLVVTCGAGVGAVVGWRRGRDAVAGLIALGVCLSAIGDVVYQVLFWIGRGTEETTPADLGYLLSYVAIIAALLVLLRRARDWLDVDAWVDIATVTLIALVLQWHFGLSDIMSDTSSPLHARIVWALYPALDAVLMALVVRTVLAHRIRLTTAGVLLAGSACWLLADFFYTVFAPTGVVSGWLDSGWMLGAVLLAAVAWCPPVEAAPLSDARADTYRVGRVRIAVALLPLLIPGTIEMVGLVGGFEPNPIPSFLAAMGLAALAYVRFVRLSRASDDARELLRSNERRARVVAANASDASVIVDADGVVLTSSPELAALLGYPGSTEGVALNDLVQVAALDDVIDRFLQVLDTPGQVHELEVKVFHPEGHEVWLSVRAVNLLEDADIGGVLVNLHDVTARKHAEDQLVYQAFHDGLTGLANRSLFTDRVQQALRRNLRTGLDIAVIFLDLDGFKSVNDSLGHAAGDELLQKVSQRIAAAVRPSDTVARLGGDEFAVLIEQTRGPIEEAVTVADRILGVLAAPIRVEGQTVTVSASLGIAVGDPEATSASLLRDADIAMYRAKAQGRGRWIVHDADMSTEAAERLQLETDLLGALGGDELRLHYQPVMDLERGQVVGFEALVRWEHRTLGLVAPDRFIPLAEDNGSILEIGAWVLDRACSRAAAWQLAYPEHRDLTIAVNVSARQVASPDLVAHVTGALARSGLDASRLILELTESTLVQDPNLAAARLRELRQLGVRLAVDDFGTGYSSLSYLRQFPVDILKIDRSFINSISDRSHVPAIVRGLLSLGRTLGLTTVAEGVELELQRDLLQQEHCDHAQGFLFARPLDEVEAEVFLQQRPLAELPLID